MAKSEIPFLLSGTYALASYTGIDRPTKDVDVFAKAGAALKMLHYFKEHDYDVEIVDEPLRPREDRDDLLLDRQRLAVALLQQFDQPPAAVDQGLARLVQLGPEGRERFQLPEVGQLELESAGDRRVLPRLPVS